MKRDPHKLRINNYNPACLSAWRANIDTQFVLDVYACAVYMVNYISKAQREMSELLQQACTEAKEEKFQHKTEDDCEETYNRY